MTIQPPVRFETLYKTDSPKDFAKGEFYQVRLVPDIEGGDVVYFIRENYGYFDNEQGRMANYLTTDPEESYAPLEEALERYEQRLAHYASGGFVHAFSF